MISQFIAYFNFSNMPTVVAVKMADCLESADIGALWLLIGFILVIVHPRHHHPGRRCRSGRSSRRSSCRCSCASTSRPQTVLAAYRVGDSPINVITPLMVYLPFIVLVAQRYKKDAGLGTIISLMIPYTVIVLVTWLSSSSSGTCSASRWARATRPRSDMEDA